MAQRKAGTGNIIPTKEKENELHDKGYNLIAGFDCSGNDSYWGKLVGVLCIMNPDYDNPYLRDGKCAWNSSNRTFSPTNRLFRFEKEISQNLLAIAYVEMEMKERDEIGDDDIAEEILAKRAYDIIKLKPDFILLDGGRHKKLEHIQLNCDYASYVDADQRIFSTTCAGVLTIAQRIRLTEAERVPFNNTYCGGYDIYGITCNQGYVTTGHKESLKEYGASHLHNKKCRELYGPMKIN